jgi:hypothetical protein
VAEGPVPNRQRTSRGRRQSLSILFGTVYFLHQGYGLRFGLIQLVLGQSGVGELKTAVWTVKVFPARIPLEPLFTVRAGDLFHANSLIFLYILIKQFLW